jgi:hypothetical protein
MGPEAIARKVLRQFGLMVGSIFLLIDLGRW